VQDDPEIGVTQQLCTTAITCFVCEELSCNR
jgi:hypothetical protein